VPTQPPIQWVPGALSLGVKRPGSDDDDDDEAALFKTLTVLGRWSTRVEVLNITSNIGVNFIGLHIVWILVMKKYE
jgi:hypothetical protein